MSATRNQMPSRRIGRFALSRDSVMYHSAAISRVMSQCIIVRAETVFIADRIEYEAFSWRFREVPEGEVMPDYEWKFNTETGECWPEEVKP